MHQESAPTNILINLITTWYKHFGKSPKYQIGKLNFPSSPEIYLPLQRREHLIKTLTVDENSIAQLINLPLRHRDPFDRLIISQALQYDLTIMTQDKAIIAYPEIKILSSN